MFGVLDIINIQFLALGDRWKHREREKNRQRKGERVRDIKDRGTEREGEKE